MMGAENANVLKRELAAFTPGQPHPFPYFLSRESGSLLQSSLDQMWIKPLTKTNTGLRCSTFIFVFKLNKTKKEIKLKCPYRKIDFSFPFHALIFRIYIFEYASHTFLLKFGKKKIKKRNNNKKNVIINP